MGSTKRDTGRRDRNAAVPGRRVRKQIEVRVCEESELGDRLTLCKGTIGGTEAGVGGEAFGRGRGGPSSKESGVFSNELKVLMSLVGGIPAKEGETRRFLNMAKRRRGGKRDGGWW